MRRYRIAAWSALYDVQVEPGSDAETYASLYALKYLRLWMPGTREGNWVQAQRRAIVASGGYELLGIADELLRMAGAHRSAGGVLTNHLGQPASPKTIAVELGLPTAKAQGALIRLSSDDVRFLVVEDVEPPTRPSGPDEGDLLTVGDQVCGNWPQRGPTGMQRDPAQTGTGGSERRPEAAEPIRRGCGPPGGREPPGGDGAGSTGQCRPEAKKIEGDGRDGQDQEQEQEQEPERALRPAAAAPLQKKRQLRPRSKRQSHAQQEGAERSTSRKADDGPPWPAAAAGGRSADAAESRPPTETDAEAAADDEALADLGRPDGLGGEPAAGGSAEVADRGGEPERGEAEAGGDEVTDGCGESDAGDGQADDGDGQMDERMQRRADVNRPPTETGAEAAADDGPAARACPDESEADVEVEVAAEPDGQLWREVREELGICTCWREMWADGRGVVFADAIVAALGVSGGHSDGGVRARKREVGVFRRRWGVLRQMGLGEAWTLEIVEAAIRKARHLADQHREQVRAGENEPMNRGAVMAGYLRKAMERAQKHKAEASRC
jgi:hypothetical protein